MGCRDDGTMSGICAYAKSRYEERVEGKRRRRSHSEPNGAGRQHGYGKLHKPPQTQIIVRNVSEKPRNRLRKHVTQQAPISQASADLFVLEYEPYPNSSQPSKVLGIYSTFDAVTLGALNYGAYKFSRDSLLDGTEYLSPTGRIKIAQTTVQQTSTRATVPERSRSQDVEHVRLDIPYPENQKETKEERSPKELVFLAIREGPQAASWIGIFNDKSLAWGACLKDKAMCAKSYSFSYEARNITFGNMPQVTAKLEGVSESGRYTWKVQAHTINGST